MVSITDARFQSAAFAVARQIRQQKEAPLRHNPTDPDHMTYMEGLAQLHGFTVDRYPALFASFRGEGVALVDGSEEREVNGDFTSNQAVDFATPAKTSQRASAHGIVTRTRPVLRMTVWITVMDLNSGSRVLASGVNQGYWKQTLEVSTDDATAEAIPPGHETYANLAWHIEYTDSPIPDIGHGSSEVFPFPGIPDPLINDPAIRSNRTQGDLSQIVVGLNRSAGGADVDYSYVNADPATAAMMVPFSGSMYFAKPISSITSANPRANFYLSRLEGGMSVRSGGQYAQYFRVARHDPTRLDFSMTGNNSINFGVSPWASDTTTFFTAKVFVQFTDGDFGWSTVLSSQNPDLNQLDAVEYIKPIKFTWHCLAAGTEVTMADGSLKKIEDFQAGMKVQGSDGRARDVQATMAAPHWGPVIVLETDRGRTLTCSETHPILTPEGLIQAADLSEGDIVRTSDGVDTVTNVRQAKFAGESLFNLWLADPAIVTFFANGFAVGDHQAQAEAVANPDPELLRKKLPERLHTDFDSYLADRAAKQRSTTTA